MYLKWWLAVDGTEEICSQIYPVLVFYFLTLGWFFFSHLFLWDIVPLIYMHVIFLKLLHVISHLGSTCYQPTSQKTLTKLSDIFLRFPLWGSLWQTWTSFNFCDLDCVWCLTIACSSSWVCSELHHRVVCQSVDILYLSDTLGRGHPGSVCDKQENSPTTRLYSNKKITAWVAKLWGLWSGKHL